MINRDDYFILETPSDISIIDNYDNAKQQRLAKINNTDVYIEEQHFPSAYPVAYKVYASNPYHQDIDIAKPFNYDMTIAYIKCQIQCEIKSLNKIIDHLNTYKTIGQHYFTTKRSKL